MNILGERKRFLIKHNINQMRNLNRKDSKKTNQRGEGVGGGKGARS